MLGRLNSFFAHVILKNGSAQHLNQETEMI